MTFQIMPRSFSIDNLARDPKSTQAILGHSRLDMTANVYAPIAGIEGFAELLSSRWLRLGLSPTKTVQ